KLDLEDFDASTGEVRVRLGKGGKDRIVYLPRNAIAYVSDWLKVRGLMPGPLLCPINKCNGLQTKMPRLANKAIFSSH
nr:integrase [Trichodesmium sp. MO_231.B1]